MAAVKAPSPPMPPTPLPAPKAVVRVQPTTVTLSADSLFAFDKSTVSTAGKKQLDAFAIQLKTLDYAFVTVSGHTDRLGDHLYNIRLSERRAQAVSAYLTQSAGVAPEKLLVRGKNGANPITQAGQCLGTRATPALIACLQADRRVELEVMGSR